MVLSTTLFAAEDQQDQLKPPASFAAPSVSLSEKQEPSPRSQVRYYCDECGYYEIPRSFTRPSKPISFA